MLFFETGALCESVRFCHLFVSLFVGLELVEVTANTGNHKPDTVVSDKTELICSKRQ
jgi:hypothetical protein